MKIPKWAPVDLRGCWETSKLEIDRLQSLPKRSPSEKTKRNLALIRKYREEGDIDSGLESPRLRTTFKVLEALITNPQMEAVWKALNIRATKFKPRTNAKAQPFPSDDMMYTFDKILKRYPNMHYTSLGGFRFNGEVSQSLDLFITCIAAKADWMNTPKLTRAKSSELFLEVAKLAGKLRAAILKVKGPERFRLWNIVQYLDDEWLRTIAAGSGVWQKLTKDEQQDRLRDLRVELDVLPRIPPILFALKQQAELFASHPRAFSQPHGREAEANHFARYLSNYTIESYGTPLNAHVATITNVILETELTEENVKALSRLDKLRTRQVSSKGMPTHKNDSR